MEEMTGVGTVYGERTILVGRLKSDGSSYVSEGLVPEMVDADERKHRRLNARIKLYRAPFAYPEMAAFEYHRIGRPVHPDEIVAEVAGTRGVKQIHAFNWNQLDVAYAA